MILPSGKTVNSSTPIYSGSHFSWGEVTKDCTRYLQDLIVNGRLIITAVQIEKKIVETAIKLDEIRALFSNRPIHVNSWYRPQHVNKAVGGSNSSRHQFGDAVDIRSDYFYPINIYKKLEPDHDTGGISCYPSFVHIDWRGVKARW